MSDENLLTINFYDGCLCIQPVYGYNGGLPAHMWHGHAAWISIGDTKATVSDEELDRIGAEARPIIKELRELIVSPFLTDRPIRFNDKNRAIELEEKLTALLRTAKVDGGWGADDDDYEEDYDDWAGEYTYTYPNHTSDGGNSYDFAYDIEYEAANALKELPADATREEKIKAIEAELADMSSNFSRPEYDLTIRLEVDDWDALFEELNGGEDEDEDE